MSEAIKRRIFWLPFALFIFLSALFSLAGLYLANDETEARISKASTVAEQVKISLEVFSEERKQALRNLMMNWPTFEPNPVDWFNAQATSLMGMQKGYSALVYANKEGIIEWVTLPEYGVRSRLDKRLIGQPIEATGLSVDANGESFSNTLIVDGEHAFILVGRVISPQEPEHGYVIGSFDVQTILTVLLGELVGPQFNFQIVDDNQILFSSGTLIGDNTAVSPPMIEFIERKWLLTMQSQLGRYSVGATVAVVGILMSMIVVWFFFKQLRSAVKLTLSQQRYQTASQAALDAILIYQHNESDFNLVEANPYAQKLFSGDVSALGRAPLSKQLQSLGHGDLYRRIEQSYLRNEPLEDYLQIRSRLIKPEWIKVQLVRAGETLAVTIRDVSARFKAQQALQQSEEKYRRLIDGLYRHFVYTKTRQHEFRYVSAGVETILGYAPDQFCAVQQQCQYQVPDNLRAIRSTLEQGEKPESYLVHYLGTDDQIKVIEFAETPVTDELGNVIAIEGIARDVTKEQALQEEVAYQATHDQLTGLMNRYAFDQHLKELIELVQTGEQTAVVCFVDMDRFKLVNDSCGHPAGDRLLKEIATLFATHVAEKDLLARIGGDEFCMIFRNQSLPDVTAKLDTLLQDIANYRFVYEDKMFFIGASIGVIEVNSANLTEAELIKAADNACYQAKYLGRNRYYVYKPTQAQQAIDNAESETLGLLHNALQNDGFELYCQTILPLHNRDSGEHFEVLLRLRGEGNTLVSPGLFIPLAERHGLMNKIDWWVVDNTLTLLEQSQQHLLEISKVAINLSGITLGDETLLRTIIQRVQSSSVPPEQLCFEITETTAVTNLAAAQGFIESLRELGCRFALDDFGAGMSSFMYLKNLNVDYVKIDGSFVRNMVRDQIDLATVTAINSIAHSMGKQTIAEFVADNETAEALRNLGVDYGQGFALGKPLPLTHKLHAYSDATSLYAR